MLNSDNPSWQKKLFSYIISFSYFLSNSFALITRNNLYMSDNWLSKHFCKSCYQQTNLVNWQKLCNYGHKEQKNNQISKSGCPLVQDNMYNILWEIPEHYNQYTMNNFKLMLRNVTIFATTYKSLISKKQ